MRSTGCLMHSLRKAFGRSAPENILLGQLRTLLFTIWMIFVIGLTLALVVALDILRLKQVNCDRSLIVPAR